MQAIFLIILIIAIYVSYRVSKNKGYSGVLFGIGAFFFPILALIVFALPDKSQAAKQAEIDRAFEESIQEQAPIKKEEPEEEKPPVQKVFAGRKVNLNVADEGEMADLIVEIEHAKKCYRDEMYILALPYFKKAAKAGHRDSQMYCGQMYYHGQGCDVNYEKALYWYEKAAEKGEPVAQGNCSYMYKEGLGCEVDMAKALYWKEKLAEQGNDKAQLELAMMYELGQGCDVDLEKARYWYAKAAEQGNADAKRLLDGME